MQTNRKTTFIILERGEEDIKLHEELLKFNKLCSKFYNSSKQTFEEFPILNNLRQQLYNELVDQDYYEG